MDKLHNNKMEKVHDNKSASFTPSPTMRIHVGHGKVIMMNRRDRRRQHLYGDRLVKREPNPPAIFHSKEEMENDR